MLVRHSTTELRSHPYMISNPSVQVSVVDS
jgi:hypothetical protein